MAITNNFVALKHGHIVGTELSRAQLWYRIWFKNFCNYPKYKNEQKKPEIVDLFAFTMKTFCQIQALIALKNSSKKNGCFNQDLPIFKFASENSS